MSLLRPLDLRRDILLPVAIAAVQVGVTVVASTHQPERRPLDALAFLLLVGSAGALAARSRHPVAVLCATFALTWTYWALDYPGGPVFLALIVALVTVVWTGRRLVAWTSLALGYVAFGWLAPAVAGDPAPTLAGALGAAAWLLLLGAGAEVVRARRERVAEIARTRAEEARRRAGEQRMGIARELHDVLAHHISMINVQAGVALHLMDERPEQARTALTAIKQASRESLGELRSVLELLRQGDEAAPRAPAPGLDALEALTSRTAAAGLPVRVRVAGTPRRLPAAVDLAAYRIVQEALTNVARHAGPATADVRLEYGDGEFVVQVDDDGAGGAQAGRPAGGTGSGSGLLGMAERAAALGGEVEAGPRSGGGFRVRARLPVPPDPTTDAASESDGSPSGAPSPRTGGSDAAKPADAAQASQDGEAVGPGREGVDPSVEVGGRDRRDE